jgi:hypothetical protein
MIIGLAGHAGAGKSTVAAYLVREHGYVERALSAPIKRLLNARFGWNPQDWDNRDWKEDAAPWHGEGRGGDFSPRSWAQWLGTEVGRTIAGPSVWIDMVLRERSPREATVIPDVRFRNEAAAIIRSGGLVWKLERADGAVMTPRSHVSEAEVDYLPHHAKIVASSPENLLEQVRGLLQTRRQMEMAFS